MLKKAIKLTNEGFATETKKYRNKQKNKIVLYCILNPLFAINWFKILDSLEFQNIVKNRPRLFFKPFRVYMSSKWNKKRRMKVILDTYRFSSKKRSLLELFSSKEEISIAKFPLKEGIDAEITLGYSERYRKEGEIVVFYKSEKLGGNICEAAFSIEEIDSEKWVARIGCVQGNKHDEQDNVMKASQKLMQGLRPKSFMIFLVQEIVKNLEISSIYGASDSIQAHKKKHAIHIKWLHSINFNYNSLWEEVGGEIESDGWYSLPNHFIKKDMSEIKTHKRAVYRRRYELLDNISMKISEYFEGNIKKAPKNRGSYREKIVVN